MLRILKFIGAFLGTLLVVLLIVFGFNLSALTTLVENSGDLQEGSEWVAEATSLKGLTEYMGAHPERVSLVSAGIDEPDSTIRYGSHAPRTMGTLSNVLLLTEYVRRVEEGGLDPEETVSLEEVDRFQLPYVDASHHRSAVRALRERGAAGGETDLQNLVRAAVEFNDLAAADYLWFRLNSPGGESLEQLMEELELAETELPLPFSGLYILMNPHLEGKSFAGHIDSLVRLPREEFTEGAIRAARRFSREGPYRERLLESFREHEGPGIGFAERRDALVLFPKSTAAEMSRLMEQISRDRLISPRVSREIKAVMEWPLEGRLEKDFSRYGAIYDSRLGMAAGIDYGTSSYTGRTYAQALFFDPLQVAFWFHLSSNLMHQDLQQRLIWDPALRTATRRAVETGANSNIDTTETVDEL